jgi:DDE family transposase
MGHALAENRHGLIVETGITQATGTAEREAAKAMIESHSPGSTRRLTLGADKAYDAAGFVAELRGMCVPPHVAQNTSGRSSAIDGRTTRHKGYALSQRKRKLIEEAFGWGKTIGGLARPMRNGTARMGFLFTFTMAAYDLIRLPRLLATKTASAAAA